MIQMIKKISIIIFVLAVSFFGVQVGYNLTRNSAQFQFTKSVSAIASAPSQQDRYENIELFHRVLDFVRNNYVDKLEDKDLIRGAIKGMLEQLDPHSNFLPPDLFKDMQIDTTGKFGGLGIEIGMKDNILTILAPIEDTPAWKAGLKPNDRIVKINKERDRKSVV